MKEVLFLLEQFGVSDEFYHELTQILPALPRSYKVKGLRKCIDDSVDIIRLPKPCFGAYRPLNQLLECLISDQVSQGCLFHLLHYFCHSFLMKYHQQCASNSVGMEPSLLKILVTCCLAFLCQE